jgi:PAS domain S-box-containing protein
MALVTLVAFIDVIATVGFLASLIFAVQIKPAVFNRPTKTFLCLCLVTYVFVGVSNVLEHGNITGYFDRFEDYAKILFLPVFVYFIYSINTQSELNRRRLVEEELAFRNAILSTQQETSLDGILVVDEQGKMISFNQRFVKMWGISPGIIESLSDERALQSVLSKLDNPEQFLSRVKFLYEHKEAKSLDEVVFKDGSIFDRYSAPMYSADKKYLGRVWYFRDITERHNAEKSLKESEIQKTLLLQSLPMAIYIAQPHGDFGGIWVSEQIDKISGFSPEQFGENIHLWASRLHPEDREDVLNEFAKLSHKESITVEYRWKAADGSYKWFLDKANLVRDNSGNPQHIIGTWVDISEHKLTEGALRESENLLQSLIDAIPDMVFSKDVHGRHLLVNKAIEETFGMNKEDFQGKTVDELFLPEVAEKCRRSDEKVVRNRTLERTEEPATDKRGNKIFLETFKVPLYDGSGNAAGIVAVARDITKRKKDEEELREAKEMYMNVVNDLPDMICRYRLDTTITFVNRTYAEYFGKSTEELIGRSFMELIPPEAHGYVFAKVKSLSQDSPSTIMEHEVFSPDGQRRWQLWHDRALFDSSGNIVEVQSIGRDITESRIAAKMLEESRAFLQSVIDGFTEPIMLIGTDFRAKLMNRAASKFSGSALSDFCYKVSHHRDTRCDKNDHPCPLEEVKRTGQAHTVVHEHIRSGGERRFIEILASPFWEPDGSFGGIIESQRDITDRLRMEEELIKVMKLESIGVLAGGLAHDFNNLLTAILGNISLARLGRSSEHKSYRLLSEAETACLRAKDLTCKLLTFSKGGKPVMKTAFVSDLLRDSVGLTLSGSNVSCTFDVAEDLWPVEVDEGQIGQVIHNMVQNAKEAMPNGGTVHITAHNTVIGAEDEFSFDEGKYVVISVEDQGAGILKEIADRIYDPYFTTKKMGTQKGVGLGLAICYSIIKNHRGHIRVKSEIGVGTTFYFYLPASSVKDILTEEIHAQRAGDVQGKSEERPLAGAISDGNARILIMDDETLVRDLLMNLLDEVGYEVECTANGEEAVASYRKALESGYTFDSVILDLTVRGGMGGLAAMKRLVEIDPNVKAIISSGYSDNFALLNCQQYGFRGILIKPFKMNELIEILNSVLSGTNNISNQH